MKGSKTQIMPPSTKKPLKKNPKRNRRKKVNNLFFYEEPLHGS
jgi:hypothetical protein